MDLTMTKRTDLLREFCLDQLGRFVRFEVTGNESAKMVFENETLLIGTQDQVEDLVATLDSKPTTESTTPTDLELADFDMHARFIYLFLSNGDRYGIEISTTYEGFADASQIPWDEDEEYIVRFIQPTI